MLTVSGLIAIPKEPELKIVPTKSGSFFNFVVVSQNLEDESISRHRVSMWVPEEDIKRWEDDIIHKNVFILVCGELIDRGNYENSFYTIKVHHTKLKKLLVPRWAGK